MGLLSTAMSPVVMFSLVMLVYLIVLLRAVLLSAAPYKNDQYSDFWVIWSRSSVR
jgi:hypothetical protein